MQAVHSRLTFQNVKSVIFDIEKQSNPTYEVSLIEANGSNINVHFHDGTVIRLEVDEIKGSLVDLDQPWDIKGPRSLSFGKD